MELRSPRRCRRASATPQQRDRGQASRVPEDYGEGVHDEPIDPFNGDPADPAAGLHDPRDDDALDPLTDVERQDVLEDLADLEIYQALLAPIGVRGLVIECEDCREPHYFDWDLLRGNLRHLLDSGRPRVHEPAYDPDPDHYVTWDYARGYADGVHDTLTEGTEEDDSADG
ncbi:hypothetical protein GA0070560_101273 [Micromonospora halophytica]|uniref:DUF5319 domain-containing protein n=1 Tax=Micromonospora halophytica TaxID=47864 RepID=A0A1C5GKP6_9ACTN|nr:hypothetical protein GA0070560_101273 [Micromonospora halophytica]